MRSIADAMREREVEVEKLKAEIDALRAAVRILEKPDERSAPVLVDAAKRWP